MALGFDQAIARGEYNSQNSESMWRINSNNQIKRIILNFEDLNMNWFVNYWTFFCWFRIDIGNNTSFPVFLCLLGWYHQVLQNFISKWIALECEDMHLTQEVLVLIIVGVKVKTWKTFILVLASTVIKIAFLIARRRTF